MENNMFTSFHYLAGNDFIYQDKVIVRVFFIYEQHNIIKPVEIIKKVNAPESYYIAQAKKIIEHMIKSGELEKYAKRYIKKEKHKKVLTVLIPVASVLALAGAGVGTYYVLQNVNVGPIVTHTLTFVGTHAKMLDKNQKAISSVEVKEGDIARYKLVGEDDNYDLPPSVTFTTSENEVLTEGYTYDNDTGYFEVKMDQDLTLTAESYEQDAIMVLYYDYHAGDDKDKLTFKTTTFKPDGSTSDPVLTIDWGDGNFVDVVGEDEAKESSHTYNGEKDRYKITFKTTNGDLQYIRAAETGFRVPNYYLSPGNEYLSEAIVLKSFAVGIAEAAGDCFDFLCVSGLNPNIKRVTIGHKVASIPDCVFSYTGVEDLFIPKTVENIGWYSFTGTNLLSSISFETGSKLTTIGRYAFGSGLDGENNILTSITLPEKVTMIHSSAFINFAKLEDLYCFAINPPTVDTGGETPFYPGCPQHIYVPAESVNEYKTSEGWQVYADIISAIPN